MSFREKWLDAVERKGSVLCAGLDPAEFEIGRGEKGLPKGVKKLEWSVKYIHAVAPYCSAIKPNINYWKDTIDNASLEIIYGIAKDEGLVVIEDAKLADIGSTNDAGILSASKRTDAVTIAPYAGNMEGTNNLCKRQGVEAITMGLMSNPEYEREKNMLVRVVQDEEEEYERDLITSSADRFLYVKRYIQLAHDANKFGLSGIVVGAPSEDNHIIDKELADVRRYVSGNMLVLSAGVGEQGGEAEALFRYFNRNNVIVNVGRSLMFPNGSNSSPKEQAETAEFYMDMLNELRAAD
tara:strand:- start:1110 stop:1994 length:885 start_codon:yes stop_codon:yes gene_type:complete